MGVVANHVALTAVYDHAGVTVTPSAVVAIQAASEAMTAALGVTSTGYNSAVCTVTLQGSNDDLALTSPNTAAWSTVPVAQLVANAANASAFASGPAAGSSTTPATLFAGLPSAVVTNQATTAEAIFSTGSYTIPANTLVVGASYRIRAVVKRVAENSTDTSTYRIRIGGTGGDLLSEYAAVAAAGFVEMQAVFTVGAVGASGQISGAGSGYSRITQAYGQVDINTGPVAAPIEAAALNTTGPLAIVVTTSQSAQSAGNQDQLIYLVIEQIAAGVGGGSSSLMDVRPYKYLRVTGGVVGSPTADVDFTADLNIIRETPGSAIYGTSIVGVSTGGVITPAAAVPLQPDADTLAVQCVFTSSNFNSSVVVAKVQVSNNGTTWFDLPSGSISATAASAAATGTYIAGPNGTNLLSVHGYRYFRVTATSSANPTVAVSIACHWKVQRNDAPTSS